MSHDACILTTKDFTILEVMLERCLGRSDPMREFIQRKLGAAAVVFREDVPADVATLNSRVTYRVNDREPDSRVISQDRMTSPIGMFLPITTAPGLALLGLAEGQTFRLINSDGLDEIVTLERVLYQPEAAKREKDTMTKLKAPVRQRPFLRLVGGTSFDASPALATLSTGFDDPGPSAA
ncbi:MAG: nucleoside-diphosphate kinase [Rhizobiaceae bacterium]